jgi:hypothetical protein
MRKYLFTPIIIVLFSSNLLGQQKINFSVFFDPSINWMKSDIKQITSNGADLGFDAGLTVDKYFADRYAFSSGISINSIGGRLNYDKSLDSIHFSVHGQDRSVAPGSTVNYHLQYIKVPVGLKFKSNQIGYLTLYANLGLDLMFNIKATGDSNDKGNTLSSDNVSDNIHIFDMAYFFGAGAEYSLGGNTALVFGLTYTNGFMNITTNSDANITNSSVALKLGILF